MSQATDPEYLAAVLDALGDAIVVLAEDGTIRWLNQIACELFGRSFEEMAGLDGLSLVHPDDLGLAAEALADSLDKPGTHLTIELRISARADSWLAVEIVGSTLLDHGTFIGLALSARPLGWRSAVRQATNLIGGGEPMESVVGQLAIVAAELFAVERSRVEWGGLLGTSGAPFDVDGPTNVWVSELLDEVGFTRLYIDFDEQDRPWSADHRALGQLREIAAMLRQREENLSQLRFLALHDGLTGLANRYALQITMQRLVAEGPVSVLFIDLDQFKLVNDGLGYHAGDTVLRSTCARLLSAISGRGTIARFGGDEFVAVVPGPIGVATVCADDIVHRLREPLLAGDHSLTITGSVGIAHSPTAVAPQDVSPTVKALLRDAGTALHQAKVEGRDRWREFDDDLRRSVVARLGRTEAVRRSLDEDEILLHYQPQCDLVSHQVVGFEALLRWPDSTDRAGPPLEFLRIAGEISLLHQLSRLTVNAACRQLCEWRATDLAASRCYVGVNLSPRELESPALVDLILGALEGNGLAPGDLQIEIVEHAFTPGGAAKRQLLALHELGVRLALDDFGTGDSSFARWRDLPIDTLKLDRSLITGVGADRVGIAIASSIATLGNKLGIVVLAEGIETEADMRFASEIGCQLGQGHFLGRPAEPAAFSRQRR